MKKIWEFAAYTILFLALILPPLFPAKAEGDYVDGDFPQALKNAKDTGQLNSSAYVAHVKTADISDTQRRIGPPVEGVSVVMGAYKNDPQYVQQMYNQSLTGQTTKAVLALYSNPPASTAIAIQDLGQTFGLIPHQAYAQGVGIGFSGLAPLLPIWKIFRNVAYSLLSIVMIVIGFMIMFRKKIDPKTVITVQNALPRVVVSLVLITFSYAIVGIMIDLMYLVIYIAIGLFASTGLLPPNPRWGYPSNAAMYTTGGLFQISGSAFPNAWGLAGIATSILGPTWVTAGVGAIVGGVLGSLLLPGIGTLIGAVVGTVAVPSALLTLLLSLAIFFNIVRLFILFLNAYIQIVLALIIGPLQLLLEAVPGAHGFDSWFKNLLANISVFPVAAALFMLSTVFAASTEKASGNIWVAPYIGFGFTDKSISAIFALGIMMAIPSVCGQIKEALKAKAAINAGPGAIFSPIGGAYQSATGAFSSFYYGQQAFHGLFPNKDKKTT